VEKNALLGCKSLNLIKKKKTIKNDNTLTEYYKLNLVQNLN